MYAYDEVWINNLVNKRISLDPVALKPLYDVVDGMLAGHTPSACIEAMETRLPTTLPQTPEDGGTIILQPTGPSAPAVAV